MGEAVIITGSCPGSGSLLAQTFPRLSSQWLSIGFTPYSLGFAPHYSGGTAPVLHRSSLLSPCGRLSHMYEINASLSDKYGNVNRQRVILRRTVSLNRRVRGVRRGYTEGFSSWPLASKNYNSVVLKGVNPRSLLQKEMLAELVCS